MINIIKGAPLSRSFRGALLAPLLVGAIACTRPSSDGDSSPSTTATLTAAVTPGARTSPAITEADLRIRVYIFADDSMMGRDAPHEGDRKGGEYIAAELKRLGLEPAGENGTWFQRVPFAERGIDSVPASSSPAGGRNVAAILRGSDPELRAQYVAIGAHKDHVGFTTTPIDHDSARAVYLARNRARMAGRSPTAAELRLNMDSLRGIRPARLDSIFNGADDDASGSMALLEIAEALASAPAKPRRSILFVWHTGEEDGLLGSAHYTSHPTVPLDSIVAQINLDMIGRGTADDVAGGGPDYLIIVGHRRMSRELGDVIDAVNARQPRPFLVDLSWDSPSHREQIYGRSDHANYARAGIPVAFFFTGLHADYHTITDEPQYLDYPHYTRIVQYLEGVVVELANRAQRVRVDRR